MWNNYCDNWDPVESYALKGARKVRRGAFRVSFKKGWPATLPASLCRIGLNGVEAQRSGGSAYYNKFSGRALFCKT